MKLVKYLFRKFILPFYILISAIISLLFTLACDREASVFMRMLPLILLLLLTLRASDDIFDYEKDSTRKKQFLSRKELTVLACFTAAAFILLNIFFYGLTGLISIAAIAYILLMEKIPPLKTVYMALLFLFYFYANGTSLTNVQLIIATSCIVVSGVYYIFKRKVKK